MIQSVFIPGSHEGFSKGFSNQYRLCRTADSERSSVRAHVTFTDIDDGEVAAGVNETPAHIKAGIFKMHQGRELTSASIWR